MTFKGIKAGDRVVYRTAQGQTCRGRACYLLCFEGHVVVDAGAGRPVVVNARNYIKHQRPVSALLKGGN